MAVESLTIWQAACIPPAKYADDASFSSAAWLTRDSAERSLL
jgi:hypothetical protein